MTLLWDTLSNFVAETCRDRDATHGHAHMEKVAQNAMIILKELGIMDDNIIRLVTIGAWLHDVADHKYDRDGTLDKKLDIFLHSITTELEFVRIKDVINKISFSKEDKYRKSGKFYEPDPVREIVSDADKIEAIGNIGLIRCADYSREIYKEKNNEEISDDQLVNAVRLHSNEKLLRLLPENFISTEAGKRMAQPLHDEMANTLESGELEKLLRR